MNISLIVALDEGGGIGKDGGLPWRLSADLKNFKALTLGHHLIVGRKTYESIGQALPGRTMIVITRDPGYAAEGCLVTGSLKSALALAEAAGETEAFVAGGAQIFALALPHANRIYLTRLHAQVDCDVFFPDVDWSEWRLRERRFHTADEKNQYDFTFSVWERAEKPNG